jgi:hypothetical protein
MYGQLPSYVKQNATIFDILVTNTVLAWEKEQYDKASGNITTPKLSQEEMQEMLNRARAKNECNKPKTKKG